MSQPKKKPITERLKEYWLVSTLSLCAAVAATTWKVSDELLVRPRDFRIDTLQKQIETHEKQVAELKSEKLQLEKQITDSTRAIRHVGDSGTGRTQEARPDEVVVDFPWVDTASAPGHTVAAAPYLHGVGISVVELKPQRSELVLINNRAIYQGQAVKPTTSQNFLTQTGTQNTPASFTLVFSKPCDSVSFTRPALYPATGSGITHPAWSAHALNATERELSSQSEDITRSFTDVPAHTYTLKAPGFEGISAVRFDSDPRLKGEPFAAFSAILIERLTLVHQSK